ncbi:hypothetical protein [Reinekea thalattae]|uniref:PilN domain-containing protein n=1 Tax=Reinekea thalattae TaxID=2593301 RepID=A0A5C8Z4M5_9GAMM|nr:hypothetical protein [Reinekea thalattae]TXR51866.1 hypothetical protein FME95_10585 [Reinekea thalattae]
MDQINFLPWRYRRDQQRLHRLKYGLAILLLLNLLLVIAYSAYMQLRYEQQQERQAYLQLQLQQVKAVTAKFDQLKDQQQRLYSHLVWLGQLQRHNQELLASLEQLAIVTPPQLVYSRLLINQRELLISAELHDIEQLGPLLQVLTMTEPFQQAEVLSMKRLEVSRLERLDNTALHQVELRLLRAKNKQEEAL